MQIKQPLKYFLLAHDKDFLPVIIIAIQVPNRVNMRNQNETIHLKGKGGDE